MTGKTAKLLRLIIAVALLGLIASGGYLSWALLVPVGTDAEETVEFPIARGQSLRRVTLNLAAAGLIRDPRILELYGRVLDAAPRVRAGTYPLSAAQRPVDILSDIVYGRALDESIRVTIPEGWRIEQIAGRLEAFGVVGAEAFTDAAVMSDRYRRFAFLDELEDGETLEGFLYPETYRFDEGSNPEDVVGRMLAAFDDRAAELLLGSDAEERRLSIREIVTLASIVQHESPTPDMPLVAGVFDNRLREGRRLESDATVNYALGTAERRPTFAQVLTQHPFNTYQRDGLPPWPIGNPGRDAIEAAVNPAEHSYYFFLHPLDGRTILSRTYAEHRERAERYLER